MLSILGACAQTDVQPMSQDTFKVSTRAAPACGASGARNVAFRAAAIEVVRQGGDAFIIVDDNTGYDGWSGVNDQGLVVRMIAPGSSEYSNALSARNVLGANWQELVTEGVPVTCTNG
ncbi:hypothetical protein DR046_08840 [Jannaschia formosa]|nr:hypothetical protein DR046_08840 [Jannaschia formosa]